jgi:uncharacterized protein YbjQ (UPF0145 family)
MARITVILEDTPAGGVSVHSDFKPAIGSKCSLAQSAALEIMNRTARDYGAKPVHGVDIDAVHRTRDNVVNVGGAAL